jgi:PIN domain nuclease of toxin-antitoxin system
MHFCGWLDGDTRLTRKPRGIIGQETNTILVSAASAWEITTKVRLGKLPGATEVASDVPACIASQQFQSLDITVAHARRAGALPGPHRDPFDRMLAAQAQLENIAIISIDDVFDQFGVARIW